MEGSKQTDKDVDDNEKLHQIIDRMLQKHGIESPRHEPYNALAFAGPLTRRSALDISRPNEGCVRFVDVDGGTGQRARGATPSTR